MGGMDWAAHSGADIVSMSLGGQPTDGTDVLSLVLDGLSEETGTLFVVAAGNTGSDYSVGSPGAAASALTVGAVDRDDKLAPFSSRGPRVGDNGVKPDLTAPGVDIVAARAAGTSMGHPVDVAYTAASGTSMATPHVAGAAAILAGRHPDWSGRRAQGRVDEHDAYRPRPDGLRAGHRPGGRGPLGAPAGARHRHHHLRLPGT